MELDFAKLNINDDFDKLINIILEENKSVIKLQKSIGVYNLLESIIDIQNGKSSDFNKVLENLDIVIRDATNAIMYSLDEESESFFDDIKIGAINSKNCINLFIKKS